MVTDRLAKAAAWVTTILTAAVIGNPAGAQDNEALPPAIDPLAVNLALEAADFLARQPDISVGWFVSYDVVVDGREKITYNRSGTNVLSRGEGFYS
jgi:hypothetical protein